MEGSPMIKKKLPLTRAYKSLLIGALAIMFTPNSYANLVANGSFENGNFVQNTSFSGTMSVPVGSTAITEWTVIGNDEIAWINLNNPSGFQWGDLEPSDGDWFLDLTEFPADAPFGGVSQNISTVVGENYTLSFDLGSSTDWGNVPSAITVNAGSASQTFTSAQPANTNEWTTYSLTFAALSSITTISFTGASGFQYIGLDNVSVLGASAVPIPAAIWLFGAALVGFIGFGKRRNSNQAN